MLNFRPDEPHEFIALEDNTRIFNIIKKPITGDNNYPVQVNTESTDVTDIEAVPIETYATKVLMNP